MAQAADPLPVEDALPELRRALGHAGVAVLQAPPGGGKTTRVPLALLDEPWLADRRILMLEPRRLAATAAAARMAETAKDTVGGLVGYRIRHDTRVGPRTRVEVVTEGILTRMLQADPALETTGLVIFDEFHERSLHADLGLALALQSRAILRSDLRLLVMSATLEGRPVAALLGQAPIVTSEGRHHPVETRYTPARAGTRIEAAVAAAVRTALVEEQGDVLAFLPGAPEIRRTAAMLFDVPADVVPLHGTLPQAAQRKAIRASETGRRKVVLASAIAETSLTIDGIRVVVDGGWSRVPRYSPRTGMTRLETIRVTRASGDQRRGRAGRQAPGVCYRLWSPAEDALLLPANTPEILETDLAPLALELALAGVAEPTDLAWLDPPPAAALAAARALLRQLGALGPDGRITEHGRRLGRFALHPRLAHMVLRARELGAGGLGCELAALLAERDLLGRSDSVPDPDMGLRLEILRGTVQWAGVDHEALRRVRAEARVCRASLRAPTRRDPSDVAPGLLLAFAYPDRIAQRRAGQSGRFLLRNGLGATIDAAALASQDYLVAVELDGRPPDSRIRLAAPLCLDDIEAHLASDLRWEDVLVWDDATDAVVARSERRLGSLVIQVRALRDPDPAAVAGVLLEAIRRAGIGRLPWSDSSRHLRARLGFLHRLDPSWLDVSDDALAADLERWLGPALVGLRRWQELERLDFGGLLLARLPGERQSAVNSLAPSHVEVPSGSRVAINYDDPANPVLAVRLQELFGLRETPRLGRGQVPLTLHLLSPSRRPVQVTRDLASFWRTTYFEVRKDLKGRYPKHHWPDDPLTAEPTRHAKRRDARGT